jgi:hypothetical protein
VLKKRQRVAELKMKEAKRQSRFQRRRSLMDSQSCRGPDRVSLQLHEGTPKEVRSQCTQDSQHDANRIKGRGSLLEAEIRRLKHETLTENTARLRRAKVVCDSKEIGSETTPIC